MELLKPQKVKESDSENRSFLESKVNKLLQEEIDITKRISLLRDKEKSEKERVDKEIEILKTQFENRKTSIVSESDKLIFKILDSKFIEEVVLLKTRYSELVSKYADKDNEIAVREKSIVDEKDFIVKKIVEIKESEDELKELYEDLETRNIVIENTEKEIKRQTLSIAEEWQKFYNKVNETNSQFSEKQKELDTLLKHTNDTIKTNEAIREENQKESKRLKEEDKLIKDKYLELERSKKFLSKK